MIVEHRSFAIALMLTSALLTSCDNAPPPKAAAPKTAPPIVVEPPVNEQMKRLAGEVYVYAYPLVLMDVMKQIATAKAPVNPLVHRRTLPDSGAADTVNANADMLLSTAWLDLSKEPLVLSVPDMHGRYYLFSAQDGWTNVFASLGKRVTGTDKADFAIVGPRWKGTLPPGVEEVKSPTEMVLLNGRTQVSGKRDYAQVNQLQDQYRLTPLSRFGKGTARTPAAAAAASPARVDFKTPATEQVAKMDGRTFFTRFATLLQGNPPAKEDAAMIEKMKKLGIVSGQPFDAGKLDAPTLQGIDEAPKATQDAMRAAAKGTGGAEIRNGWTFHLDLGRYGINYGKRAFVAWMGLEAEAPEDEIAMATRLDGAGKPLDGTGQYVLHFDSGKAPPADGLWSVTLYNDKQQFVPGALDRHALGDRDKLKTNADGSIDLYVQSANPGGDKEPNWLPAPKGAFNLMLRIYAPKPDVLGGRWTPPPVKRVS